VPSSPPPAVLPEEPDPTLAGSSHTFVSTTSVIPYLNNCETLLPDLRGQEVEGEQAEFNLGSTRAWYDGRSSSCEGDSSDEEDVEEGFTWPPEVLHQPLQNDAGGAQRTHISNAEAQTIGVWAGRWWATTGEVRGRADLRRTRTPRSGAHPSRSPSP
jgi:hypothetical protein